MSVPNTAKAFDVAVVLHEVGHHVGLNTTGRQAKFLRLNLPLNFHENNLLDVLLAIVPIAVGLLWTSLFWFGIILLAGTTVFYLQMLEEEKRAWELAENCNKYHLHNYVPAPLFQSIRRTGMFTYEFFPNMIWVGVLKTRGLLRDLLNRLTNRQTNP